MDSSKRCTGEFTVRRFSVSSWERWDCTLARAAIKRSERRKLSAIRRAAIFRGTLSKKNSVVESSTGNSPIINRISTTPNVLLLKLHAQALVGGGYYRAGSAFRT